MNLFSLFLSVGILWFLITLFTRSGNSSVTLAQTWIVTFGMLIISLMIRLTAAFLLHRWIGPYELLISVPALYLLVGAACDTNRKTTLKICGWYLGISLFLSLLASIATD